MRRELGFGIWIWRRASKWRDFKVVEMDFREELWIATVMTKLHLAVVGGGSYEVDRNIVGDMRLESWRSWLRWHVNMKW